MVRTGLGRQARLDIRLEATEHERAKDLVQLGDHALLRLHIVNVEVEPLVELLGGREHLGQQEVEQRPELVQVVLQRRACQQQAVLRVQRSNSQRELRSLVLQTVRFVDDLPTWTNNTISTKSQPRQCQSRKQRTR